MSSTTYHTYRTASLEDSCVWLASQCEPVCAVQGKYMGKVCIHSMCSMRITLCITPDKHQATSCPLAKYYSEACILLCASGQAHSICSGHHCWCVVILHVCTLKHDNDSGYWTTRPTYPLIQHCRLTRLSFQLQVSPLGLEQYIGLWAIVIIQGCLARCSGEVAIWTQGEGCCWVGDEMQIVHKKARTMLQSFAAIEATLQCFIIWSFILVFDCCC